MYPFMAGLAGYYSYYTRNQLHSQSIDQDLINQLPARHLVVSVHEAADETHLIVINK